MQSSPALYTKMFFSCGPMTNIELCRFMVISRQQYDAERLRYSGRSLAKISDYQAAYQEALNELYNRGISEDEATVRFEKRCDIISLAYRVGASISSRSLSSNSGIDLGLRDIRGNWL